MRSILLSILICLLVTVGETVAQDYTTLVWGGIVHNSSSQVLLKTGAEFNEPAMYITVVVSPYNIANRTSNTTDPFEPLTINVGYEKNQTTVFFHTITINGYGNFTDMIVPCNNGYSGPLNFTFVATPINQSAYYNISLLSVDFVSTVLGSRVWITYPHCPGARYFFADVPEDHNAYNLTFGTSAADEFEKYFDELSVQLGTCPNSNTPSAQIADASRIEKGFALNKLVFGNLRPGGRYWVRLNCKYPKSTINTTSIDLQTTIKKTCDVSCFTHGVCVDDPPLCTCSTWWDGENCTVLYRGDFALIAVSGLVCLLSIYCLVRLLIQCNRKRPALVYDDEDDEDFGVMESSPSTSFSGNGELNPLLRKSLRNDKIN